MVEDIKKGEVFTEQNIRSIRPGYGLKPKYIKYVLGRKAKRSIKRGMPLKWTLVENFPRNVKPEIRVPRKLSTYKLWLKWQ